MKEGEVVESATGCWVHVAQQTEGLEAVGMYNCR